MAGEALILIATPDHETGKWLSNVPFCVKPAFSFKPEGLE
jgi:hypothetical protein